MPRTGRPATPLPVRFWRFVLKADGCWRWCGRRNAQGYGSIREGASHTMAHRLSWRLHNGDIPAGMLVLHKCDNPPCVNPAHLFLGTSLDNAKDRDAKGRHWAPRGEQRKSARFTDAERTQIKAVIRYSRPQWKIAALYGLKQSTVSNVSTGETWRWV
jgi:HNH endonuclease